MLFTLVFASTIKEDYAKWYALYYGSSYTSTTIGGVSVTNFDSVVLPDKGYNNSNIRNVVAANKDNVHFYGYVPIGEYSSTWSPYNYSLSEIASEIDNWANIGVYGIFLDEFGFDYKDDNDAEDDANGDGIGSYRERQKYAVDYAHSKGLHVIVNSWGVDDAFGPYGEDGRYMPIDYWDGDGYCFESMAYYGDYDGNVHYSSPIGKALRLFNYMRAWAEEGKTLKVFPLTTAEANRNIETDGPNPSDTDTSITGDQGADQTGWWVSVLFGFSNYQYTDVNYNAAQSTLYWPGDNNHSWESWYVNRPDIGTEYANWVVGKYNTYVYLRLVYDSASHQYNAIAYNDGTTSQSITVGGVSATVPAHQGVVLSNVSVNPPTLSYYSEDARFSDGVSPDEGELGTSFTFKVVYTDAENDPPGMAYLTMDLDGDGAYETSYKMAPDSSESVPAKYKDGDYTNGELYTVNIAINYFLVENVKFKFLFSDYFSEATGDPATTGGQFKVYQPILLSWVGTPGFIYDGVEPSSATAGSEFTFKVRVKYKEAPETVQLWIDLNDDGIYSSDEKINMVCEDETPDYASGAVYSLTMRIFYPDNPSSDGIINYRFYAASGNTPAVGNPTYDHFLTVQKSSIKVPLITLTPQKNFISSGDKAVIRIDAAYSSTAEVLVYDVYGRVIDRSQVFLSRGSNYFEWSPRDKGLASGFYIFSVSSDSLGVDRVKIYIK